MTAASTRAVVEDLYASYSRGDIERISTLIDDDIDWIIHGPMHVFPFVGARRGKAAVLEALGAMAKEYDLQRYEPKRIIVEDDRAAVLSEVAFLQRETGRVVSVQLVNFLIIRDGRLVEFREFSNTFDLVEQALGRSIEVA